MPAPSPTAYVRSYDFSDHERDNPAAPAAGAQHDAQLDSIATSISTTIAALADVRRADGALANYLVTLDSLSATVRLLLGGWVPRGAWVTATAYAAKDLVRDGTGDDYVCVVAHTSGVFATDEAAGKWMKVAVLTAGGYATGADVAAAQAAAIASAAGSLAAHVALANPHGTTAADVAALPLAGGTLLGALTLSGAPTVDLHAATKKYADDAVAAYAPLAGATFSGNIISPKVSATDANLYMQVSGSIAYVVFAANNYIAYDRTNEWFVIYTDSALRAVVDKTGRVILGGSSPASGYTTAGDLTLPAARSVRALNTTKAWAVFNGTTAGTNPPTAGFNITSIQRTGTGTYTVNITNAMADANYAVFGTARGTGGVNQYLISLPSGGAKTTTSFALNCMIANVGQSDSPEISIEIKGN